MGHTQQGVQCMLCTERRPMLLLLVIYTISKCLKVSHIFQVVVVAIILVLS